MLKQKNDEINLYVKQLELSNEELRQFAHAASHDLREPVRMIVSYAELLEMSAKKVLNEEQREFIGYLKEGGKRINDMLAGILAFSKVTGQQEEITHTDLNDTLRFVIENLAITITTQKASVRSVPLPTVRVISESDIKRHQVQ
jgi:light-regulated signal transduction histidine kinase (bacteriophytochrome)